MSATEAALLTTELLELILLRLPMQDLLLAEAVSHKWQGVIQGSTKIQQALFLVPRSPNKLEYPAIPSQQTVLVGGLLLDIEFPGRSWRTTKGDTNEYCELENPLFSRIFKPHDRSLEPATRSPRNIAGNVFVELREDEGCGSWRNMQLASPRVSQVVLTVMSTIERFARLHLVTVRGTDGDGLTFGDVVRSVTSYGEGYNGTLIDIEGRRDWTTDTV
ncbi:hypothetical protein LTR85_001774 [Meristemomyces frigidus]|nr:hypothetical protein LTR85_001774 [Meristemomyces frigidus]